MNIDAKNGSLGFCKNGTRIIIYDSLKQDNPRNTEFDWSKGYKELEEFFDGTIEFPFGACDDMDKIKEGLPEILRKQGWIK